MPVYEFRCPQCGKVFDVLRPRSEAGQPASCPDDGTEGYRIFGAAVITSGSGGGDEKGENGDGESSLGGMEDDDFSDLDF